MEDLNEIGSSSDGAEAITSPTASPTPKILKPKAKWGSPRSSTTTSRRGSMNGPLRKLKLNHKMDRETLLQILEESHDHMPYYTTISLDEVIVDSKVAAELLRLIKSYGFGRMFERMDLEFCEGRGVSSIIQAALLLECVKHLFVSNDASQDSLIVDLSTCLQVNSSLNSLWLLVPLSVRSVQGISQMLQFNSVLDKLSLSGSTFDDPNQSAKLLRQGLMENTGLRIFDLSCCSLDDNSIATILEGLVEHTGLEYLDLSRNACREKSMEILSSILQQEEDESKLNTLDLREQNLQENEVLNISPLTVSLRKNTMLEKLRLSHNNLTDSILVELIEALRYNSTLQELDLQWNKITDKGVNAISSQLPQITGLEVLLLGGNQFGKEGYNELDKLPDDDQSIATVGEFDESWNGGEYIVDDVGFTGSIKGDLYSLQEASLT